MGRRAGIVFVLALVALGPRALCPRGLTACLQPASAAHDCCAPTASLDASRCCCAGAGQAAEAPAAAGPALLSVPATACATALAVLGASGAPAALPPALQPAAHGPPDTLLARQVALLL